MPRPTIAGTIVRDILLYCDVGNHDKEYRIVITQDGNGYRVFTEYGPRGRLNNGSEKTTAPVGRGKADLMVSDLCDEKFQKGYGLVRDQASSAPAPSSTEKPKPRKAAPKPAPSAPKVSFAQLPEGARKAFVPMF